LWLIVTLSSLLALILLVFSIPLDLTFHLDVHGRTRFSLKLVWLFGLVGKELRRRKKKAKPKKAKEKGEGARKTLKILRTKGLPKQIKILVTNVFNSLSIKQLRVNFRVGFDNPADTGLLFAVIGPTFVLFSPPDRYSINIRPSFEDEAILEGYMQAVVRLLPIRLVIPLAKFVFSLPTLRFIRTTVSAKWKKKR
jgi:hypothetical protein